MTTAGHKREFTASAQYLVLPIQNEGEKAVASHLIGKLLAD
jgi:hypothetical protein